MYAERLSKIAPFRVMELMERARILEGEGHRLVHFEVGEPDFPTADPIARAGTAAIADGQTKYTVALGLPELRQRIAQYYGELGLDIPWQRVVVTSGASGGLVLLNGLLLNPGDQLLVTDPGYPCNEAFAALVNAEAVRVVVAASDGFQLSDAAVSAHWGERTRGLLLASPANPTGAIQSRESLLRVIRRVRSLGGFVILDEIYQGLVYAAQPDYQTGLELDSDLFVLNSFSKYFGMTGWRLGWMVVPPSAVEPINRLAQNLFISPSAIAQRAAVAAFSDESMATHEARRQEFARRRDRLADGLQNLGLGLSAIPQGAFYLYVDVSSTGMGSYEFCWRLIDEYHVAVTPGIDFGSHLAERFVRFAYTTDMASIDLGVERLSAAFKAWGVGCN
jgi:aspartate/methionine/tyrosine aminotransferase